MGLTAWVTNLYREITAPPPPLPPPQVLSRLWPKDQREMVLTEMAVFMGNAQLSSLDHSDPLSINSGLPFERWSQYNELVREQPPSVINEHWDEISATFGINAVLAPEVPPHTSFQQRPLHPPFGSGHNC